MCATAYYIYSSVNILSILDDSVSNVKIQTLKIKMNVNVFTQEIKSELIYGQDSLNRT